MSRSCHKGERAPQDLQYVWRNKVMIKFQPLIYGLLFMHQTPEFSQTFGDRLLTEIDIVQHVRCFFIDY